MTSSGFTPDLEQWDAWHPEELEPRLRQLEELWAFAAGWAIELFVGGEPRPHDDLEIVVGRESFPAVQAALPELELFVVGDGAAWPLDDAPEEPFQTWGRERSSGLWRIDVFRDRWEGDTWVCRRDPAIRRPVAEVIDHTEDGVPYLAPEIVLLFKAKAAREKDERDLERALPLLERARRAWLADALRLVHPGHAWIDVVDAPVARAAPPSTR